MSCYIIELADCALTPYAMLDRAKKLAGIEEAER